MFATHTEWFVSVADKGFRDAEVKSPDRIGIFDSKLRVEKRETELTTQWDGGGRTGSGRGAERWREKGLGARRGWSFAVRDSASMITRKGSTFC